MEKNKNNNGYKTESIAIDSKPYIRISQEGNSLAYSIPIERYEDLISRVDRMKEIAQKLVFGRTGYLHANDRTLLRKYVSTPTERIVAESVYNRKDPDEKDFENIFKRANYFSKNIPGVFLPEFESSNTWEDEEGKVYHSFPTVDTIFNIFARDGGRSYTRGNGYAKRTSLENVLYFRELATGSYAEQAKKQILDEIDRIYKEKFDSDLTRQYVLDHAKKAIEYLQKELKPASTNAIVRTFNKGSETEVEEIVSKPFWYTGLNEQSVEKILRAYWANFAKNCLESDSPVLEQTKKDLVNLFPDYVPDLESLENVRAKLYNQRLEEKANEAVNGIMQAGAYAQLSTQIFERCSDRTKKRLEECLADYIVGNVKSEVLGESRKDLVSKLNLPSSDSLNRLYDNALIQAAKQKINNSNIPDFVKMVNAFNGRVYRAAELNPLMEAKINSPEFKAYFVDYWASQLSLSDLGVYRFRNRIGIESYRFDKVASELIDKIQTRKIAELEDTEFLEYITSSPAIDRTNPETREIVAERIFRLLDEDVKNGIGFERALKQHGIEFLTLPVKKLVKAKIANAA